MNKAIAKICSHPGIALMLGFLLWVPEAYSGGAYIPDFGVRGVGRAGAFVVGADDLMALHYNPAALTRLKKTSFMLDISLVQARTKFQRAPGITRPDGTVVDPNVEFPLVENQAPKQPIPGLLFGSDLETLGCEECAVAFGLYAPFGAGSRFPAGGPQRYSIIQSSSIVLFASAAFARPITPWLKVGVQGSAVYIQLGQELAFQLSDTGIEDPAEDLVLNASLGDWTWSYGAGVLFEPVDWFALGASFQSEASFEVAGTLTATAPQLGGLSASLPAKTQGALPAVYRFGALIRPIPNLEIEADIVRYNWSSFDTFLIEFQGQLADLLDPVPLTFEYDDIWNPRLGVELKGLGPVRLRGGVYYEESAVPLHRASVSGVSGNKWLYSAGMTYDFGSWDLDLAYAYLAGPTRVSDISQASMVNLLGPTTITGNGTYDGNADIISVGFHFYPGRERGDR